MRVRDLPHDVRAKLGNSFRVAIKEGRVDNAAFAERVKQIVDEFQLTDLERSLGNSRFTTPDTMMDELSRVFAQGSVVFSLGNDVGELRGRQHLPAGWTNQRVDQLIERAERYGPFEATGGRTNVTGKAAVDFLVAGTHTVTARDWDPNQRGISTETHINTLDELTWYIDRKAAENKAGRAASRTIAP